MVKDAAPQNLQPVNFDTGVFKLSGMLRTSNMDSAELVVYIEGDGHTLNRRNQLRNDPTPPVAQGFQLAMADPAPQLFYLARIGQFNSLNTGEEFKKYWGNARFSPEAVQAADQAIDQVKERTGAEKIHLVGFSGGGGIAVILAGQRKDVASLTTVAGLLDTQWWVLKYLPSQAGGIVLHANAFSLSINPADLAHKITALPQLHFSGSKDTNIPPEMVTRFREKVAFQHFQQITLPYTHNDGWTENWPRLLELHVIPLRTQSPKGE